jgi:hypothetical protein
VSGAWIRARTKLDADAALQDRRQKALALQTVRHEEDELREEEDVAAYGEAHAQRSTGNKAPSSGAEVLLHRDGVQVQSNLTAKADDDFGR